MLKRISVLSLSVVLLALCCAALAGMGARLELARDVQKGDVICTGRIIDTVIGSADSKGQADIVATFQVDRVVKGDVEPGSSLKVHYRDQSVSPRSPFPLGYVLAVFGEAADYYVPVMYPDTALQASEETHTPYARSGDVMNDLRWEILNALKDSSSSIVKSALQQAAVLTPEQVKMDVIPFATGKDDGLVVAALTGLARSGSLSLGVAYLLAHAADLGSGPIIDLTGSIVGAKLNSEDLPAVGGLMKCNSVQLRRIGSHLLRSSASTAALPQLKAALNDSDIEVRYDAVMGLADILGDRSGHAPFLAEYRAHERGYLHYWKSKAVQ